MLYSQNRIVSSRQPIVPQTRISQSALAAYWFLGTAFEAWTGRLFQILYFDLQNSEWSQIRSDVLGLDSSLRYQIK